MPPDFDHGKRTLAALAAGYADADRNEATTRLHLIDSLFFEALGWAREECVVERHADGEYTDYEFGTPERLLVVEAKREGAYFDLPAGTETGIRSLASIVTNPPLDAAVRQALRYCQDRSIGYAVVTNGIQAVAFLASRSDGVPALKGRALVITSLLDAHNQFRVVWDNLSRPAVYRRNLSVTLRAEAALPPPDKLSQRIVQYPGHKNRNEIQVELQILGGLVIDDIARVTEIEPEFLRACYCTSGALSQYALVSKDILAARYRAIEEDSGISVAPVSTKDGIADKLNEDTVAAALSHRPIILLGDVGVGKSIFIRHLITIGAPEIFERAITLTVDFGSQPALSTRLGDAIVAQFERQLRTDYDIDIMDASFVRSVYNAELNRFKRSVYGPLLETDPLAFQRHELDLLQSKLDASEDHLKASLVHVVASHHRQVVMFFDNIDQRPYDFQEAAFLIAQSIAQTWPGTVFLALRPETFRRSSRKGAIAAYAPRVFTVDPPRVDIAIRKRLAFSQRALQEGLIQTLQGSLGLRSPRLSSYLTILDHSLEASNGLAEVLDNLSNGNVRRALQLLAAFVGSGHVDTAKIFDIYDRTGSYVVPVHEFLRACIFGDFQRYDPNTSAIVNVFDISSRDQREHFLLPVMLSAIERWGSEPSTHGYVSEARIFEYCQSIGFGGQQVVSAMERADAGRLIELAPDETGHGSARARILPAGAYTRKRLMHLFAYVDAMAMDTPIIDPAAREAIGDVFPLQERIERCTAFVTYLDDCWKQVSDARGVFEWPPVSSAIRSDMDFAAARSLSRQPPSAWP